MKKTTHRARQLLIVSVLATCALALTSLAATNPPAAKAPAPLLDGKTFNGQLGEHGQKTGVSDTLTFSQGQLRSSTGEHDGFQGATYTAKKEGTAIHFEAVLHSEKQGSQRWKGTLKGNELEATMSWTKPQGKPVEYWFKGALGA